MYLHLPPYSRGTSFHTTSLTWALFIFVGLLSIPPPLYHQAERETDRQTGTPQRGEREEREKRGGERGRNIRVGRQTTQTGMLPFRSCFLTTPTSALLAAGFIDECADRKQYTCVSVDKLWHTRVFYSKKSSRSRSRIQNCDDCCCDSTGVFIYIFLSEI